MEIDLLEVVKQLRLSRFMSSIFMTKNQRELVKFQRDYMLDLKKRKHTNAIKPIPNRYQPEMSERTQSIDTFVSEKKKAMKSFKPDQNEIDAKLYTKIVDVAGLERWR